MNANYLTPRIAIAHLTSLHDLESATKQLQLRHKHYFHFFNLTNAKLPAEREAAFKWRGVPFSLSEAVRLMTQVDTFLRANIANAAIICVANAATEEYARIIVKSYIDLCLASAEESSSKPLKSSPLGKLSDSIAQSHPYFLREVQQVYRTISLHSPPVKILESLTIHPQELFIPLVEIFNEGRYNDFEPVYSHAIEEELAVYYLNLNRPLETGIGRRYYDSRPETKYFSKPVVVFGDVKIVVSSYKTLKKVYEFTAGFNTLNIDALNPSQHERKVLKLGGADLYDRSCDACELRIEIEYSDYCEVKCGQRSSCPECRELQKKMSSRYGEVQQDLEKLHRARSLPEVRTLLSL